MEDDGKEKSSYHSTGDESQFFTKPVTRNSRWPRAGLTLGIVLASRSPRACLALASSWHCTLLITPQGLKTNIILLIIYTAACGGTLTAPEGNITSPSYPDNYPKNKRCLWKITGPRGQRISLKFDNFQLEGNGYGVMLFRKNRCLIN